jgi:hypothetical protein
MQLFPKSRLPIERGEDERNEKGRAGGKEGK